MRHLVGASNEFKMEASEYRQDNFCMENELNQAKMLMQSERNSAQSVYHEYSESHRRLEMAHSQLAHLADRSNDAARAYAFKDAELTRSAPGNEHTVCAINRRAELGKTESEFRL